MPDPSDDTLILKNRLIAFLDVLGFENRMTKETPEALVRYYSQFLNEANGSIFNPLNITTENVQERVPNFARAKFAFDSIILVSTPIGDVFNASKFVLTISLLMEQALRQQLPLRGAIALGDYVENTAQGVFISPAFKALFQEEQATQWTGCCVLDSAENTILEEVMGPNARAEPACRQHPLIRYPVPIRNSKGENETKTRWCINWRHMLTDDEATAALDYLTEPKRTNTLQFSTHVISLPGPADTPVPGEAPPLFTRFMPTRGSMRVTFLDSQGKRTNPKREVKISIGYPSEEKPAALNWNTTITQSPLTGNCITRLY